MQRLRSGSSVAYSDVTWVELRECSESRTLIDLDWAFEADHDDTDLEPSPCAEHPEDDERDGADSAVATPNDGAQDVENPAVADPAVADPEPQIPPWRSGSSCGGSSNIALRPRKDILKPASNKLYAQRGEMQVFHMTDMQFSDDIDDIHTYATAAELRHTTWRDDVTPCQYCMRDVHMATYVLGAKADPNDLAHALRKTGMPIIVLVFTVVVSDCHDIYKALNRWATIAQKFNGRQPPEGSEAAAALEFLEDKRIVALGMRGDIFVCLHKDRVKTATFEERVLSCREQESDDDIQFGTLTVHFHEGRCDPGDYVRIGIVVTRFRMTDAQVEALAQWIILHRLAVLTGLFAHSHDHRSNNKRVTLQNADSLSPYKTLQNRDSPLTDLARRSRAVGSAPLFQQIDLAAYPDERQIWAIPVPWMFFGYERAIKQPVSIARAVLDSDGLDFGSDLYQELMRVDYIPYWPPNTSGHAYVPYLDVIRVTPIDWELWIDGCVMTAVRFGKSLTPRPHKKQPRRLEFEHVERKMKRHRRHAESDEN